jgi:hypothetical protein
MVQVCLGNSRIRIGERIILVSRSPRARPRLFVSSNEQIGLAGAKQETQRHIRHIFGTPSQSTVFLRCFRSMCDL